MKTNKAPEKIYIQPMLNPSDGYVGVAWSDPYCDAKEYTRTDAFIEKAVKWINEHTSLSEKLVVENFVNYMKGE